MHDWFESLLPCAYIENLKGYPSEGTLGELRTDLCMPLYITVVMARKASHILYITFRVSDTHMFVHTL